MGGNGLCFSKLFKLYVVSSAFVECGSTYDWIDFFLNIINGNKSVFFDGFY